MQAKPRSRHPSKPPKLVVEACELLDYLYGFDHIDDPNRYSMAEHFRDDAVRMVVLHFHLSSEELLKALTYEAIRDVAGPETFSDDQDIKYLQQLRTGEAIDLAARLRVIGKRTHKLLVELNALRNRASHYWVLSRYPSGSKRAMKARSRPRYPLEWKNKLLTPKRCKTEFIPVYGALYLDMWMAYYGDEDDPPPRELLT